MRLAERKHAELRDKAASLERELTAWRAEAVSDHPLARHHSQLEAVANVLLMLAEPIQQELDERTTADGVLAEALGLERRILAVHRLWEFFRSKLALRWVPWFTDYLALADDLAWACYEPAQARVPAGKGKEPPLVFLNGGTSPFTLARGSEFAGEQVPGEPLRAPSIAAALHTLPVPVIGVPWGQLSHLPDLPAIGHEVGHDVEQDLALATTSDALISAALSHVPDERRRAWLTWRAEAFADVYGTLSTGPAFAGCLIDALADDPRRIASDPVGDGRVRPHPPRSLRVLACLHALRRMRLEPQAEELGRRWDEIGADSTAIRPYEADVAPVVDALLDGSYPQLGDAGLLSLLAFTPEMLEQTEALAVEVARGRDLKAGDVRTRVAAARLAYERDPAGFIAGRRGDPVVRGIRKLRPRGVRATRARGRIAPARRASTRPARSARDEAAAARIAELLARATTDPTDTGGIDVQAPYR